MISLNWSRRHPKQKPRRGVFQSTGPKAPTRLFVGDNLDVLANLKLGQSVGFAYLDPPFFTGKTFGTLGSGGKLPAFEDRWADLETYLEYLRPRLQLVFNGLAPDGSFVLHVDSRTSHYLKVMCDELFGAERFASEIIWRYRRWPSKTPNFQRVHDTLLRYTKSAEISYFNQLYEPLAASTRATWGTRKQQAEFDGEGRRKRSRITEEESPGTPMGDVWEISIPAPISKERTGYPTQKPEALLERLLLALTRPGDLVLDPFAGSGTTLAVAARLGRHCVGIDFGEVAVATISERLAGQGVPLEISTFLAHPQ